MLKTSLGLPGAGMARFLYVCRVATRMIRMMVKLCTYIEAHIFRVF